MFGLRIGRNPTVPMSDRATSSGAANWVEVIEGQVVGTTTISSQQSARAAAALKLTAYYRPEDMDLDRQAIATGSVRILRHEHGTGSAREQRGGDNHWERGLLHHRWHASRRRPDTTTTTQTAGGVTYTLLANSTPEYQPLVIGFFDFAMMDNIAYQPGRGNFILHEDGEGPASTPRSRQRPVGLSGRDGADKDILGDGCIKIGTINDQSGSLAGGGGAEWTGGVFDASGKRFFVEYSARYRCRHDRRVRPWLRSRVYSRDRRLALGNRVRRLQTQSRWRPGIAPAGAISDLRSRANSLGVFSRWGISRGRGTEGYGTYACSCRSHAPNSSTLGCARLSD